MEKTAAMNDDGSCEGRTPMVSEGTAKRKNNGWRIGTHKDDGHDGKHEQRPALPPRLQRLVLHGPELVSHHPRLLGGQRGLPIGILGLFTRVHGLGETGLLEFQVQEVVQL
jgi:hypothetical protein